MVIQRIARKRMFNFISANRFSVFLLAIVLLSAIVALVLYKVAFSGGLSSNPDNWSAFGGFVGGVFGPLVSLVTLIAILRTIDLQRGMLKSQSEQFEQMQGLQVRMFEAQQAQIDEAISAARLQAIEATRASALSMIDRYINTTLHT